MAGDFNKIGIRFNLKHIREKNEELWNRYKDRLIEGYPAIQELDHVYMNELIEHIDGRILLEFLRECMLKELREGIDSSHIPHVNFSIL